MLHGLRLIFSDILLPIALYIVLPIFIIRRIIQMLKSHKRSNKKKYRYIYWPLIILCAVPGFCCSTASIGNNLDSSIGELWINIMGITFLITMVWTIIQYKVAGLWVGLIRFLIGYGIGALASIFIILGLGVILFLLIALSDSDTIYIIKDGEYCALTKDYDGQSYIDREGNVYRNYKGVLYDDLGRRYTEYGGKN